MSNNEEFIQQYKIIDDLGEGAFAKVYLARKKDTDELIAVKVIDKSKCEDDLFKNELSIQRKFDSPYIINIYSYFETSESFTILMEYANGGELFQAIVDNHSYSENDAATIIQQILIGLKILHDNNVIHRDLKPANLLLSIDYEKDTTTVKISDFGLAGIISNDKLESEFYGSRPYSAPEIIEGTPYDSSVDIWSLGVIVFILLGGYYPFESDSDFELENKILNAEYDFNGPEWNEISQEARDFITQMLQVDPKNRITIEDALKHPWLSGNAPKVQLGDLREHLKAFNLKQKLKRVANATKTAIKFKNLLKNKNDE